MKQLLRVLVIVTFNVALLNWAFAAPKDAPASKGQSLESTDVPVILYEYASLTCVHCAHFHNDILPILRKKYVDTGKLRVVTVDFPLDPWAMGAALIVHGAPEDARDNLRDAFFAAQRQWTSAKQPLNALKQIALLSGLSGEAVDAYLSDGEMQLELRKAQAAAQEHYGIRVTPTFIINGTMYEGGGQDAAYFSDIIDALLANR